MFIFLSDYRAPHYSPDMWGVKLRDLIGVFPAVMLAIPPVGRGSGPHLGGYASKQKVSSRPDQVLWLIWSIKRANEWLTVCLLEAWWISLSPAGFVLVWVTEEVCCGVLTNKSLMWVWMEFCRIPRPDPNCCQIQIQHIMSYRIDCPKKRNWFKLGAYLRIQGTLLVESVIK
jgi:hypothetical protein